VTLLLPCVKSDTKDRHSVLHFSIHCSIGDSADCASANIVKFSEVR